MRPNFCTLLFLSIVAFSAAAGPRCGTKPGAVFYLREKYPGAPKKSPFVFLFRQTDVSVASVFADSREDATLFKFDDNCHLVGLIGPGVYATHLNTTQRFQELYFATQAIVSLQNLTTLTGRNVSGFLEFSLKHSPAFFECGGIISYPKGIPDCFELNLALIPASPTRKSTTTTATTTSSPTATATCKAVPPFYLEQYGVGAPKTGQYVATAYTPDAYRDYYLVPSNRSNASVFTIDTQCRLSTSNLYLDTTLHVGNTAFNTLAIIKKFNFEIPGCRIYAGHLNCSIYAEEVTVFQSSLKPVYIGKD